MSPPQREKLLNPKIREATNKETWRVGTGSTPTPRTSTPSPTHTSRRTATKDNNDTKKVEAKFVVIISSTEIASGEDGNSTRLGTDDESEGTEAA